MRLFYIHFYIYFYIFFKSYRSRLAGIFLCQRFV